MSITVKNLCEHFKFLKDNDIAQLVGKKNYNKNDIIPLGNFAACNNFDIQVFAAKNEKTNFTNLLKGQNQTNVIKASGVNPTNNTQSHDNGLATPSIFSKNYTAQNNEKVSIFE